MIWSVDGMSWNIGCTVERTAEMTSSEISGMMLDKSYFNDVLGTFMRYDIRIEVPFGREDDYAAFYEVITQPVGAHEFVLPYNSGTINVVGRVENIKDIYVRMAGGKTHWKGITFSVIANNPTKKTNLNDAIVSMGFPALPPETDVNVGAVYIYGASGWEELPDAEDNYY